MDSQIEEIKNRLNVVEVIGSYIKLKKAGANYRGVCPFHSEKKPSFFVSPARQIWHCFGCSEGSSIFDFVMKIEGVEFGDALRILAQKAGIELIKQDPQLKTARQRLYEICELACLFFEKQLEASVTGQEVKKYLLGRGINEESIKKWRLGYSPEVWQGLSDFLVSRGYNREEIVKAGLAVQKEGIPNTQHLTPNTQSYDRFRARIMFPVFDLNSQVIGFGARITENKKLNIKNQKEEEIAKYINTPQTILYDKGQTLYGLNWAKIAIRKQVRCVVTEGYTDVIMAHQAGFENTIAVSGTALTHFHLNILKRYTENLVLAFDMDVAGNTATKRGIDLAQEQGFGIKIVEQSKADSDPADVILENPANWKKAVDEARSILDFYFDSALSIHDKNTPDGKKAIGKIILPIIKRIPNKIEQSFWVQKLASTLSVKEEVVLEELKKVKVESASMPNYTVKENVESPKVVAGFICSEGRKKILEEKIISLIIKDFDSLNLVNIQHLPLFSEKVKGFLEDFKKFISEQPAQQGGIVKQSSTTPQAEGGYFKKVLTDFIVKYSKGDSDQDLRNFLAVLSLRAEVEYDEDAEEEIQLCLAELKSIEVKNKLKELSEELKKAEESKDAQKINILMEQFNKLAKEL